MHQRVLPILFAFVLTLFTFTASRAQGVSVHQSEIEACGFSNDGKYFVFTQIVPGDYGGGTGNVFVIDVATNEWAHRPVVLEMTDVGFEVEDIRDSLNQKRDSVLAKYKVKLGNIGQKFTGKEVTINNQKYKLDLQAPGNLIDLHLKGNGKDITLQKDTKLPRSRGSVRAYRLSYSYAFSDKIAVFIEYDGSEQEGFENSRYYDRKYIAVTAAIK